MAKFLFPKSGLTINVEYIISVQKVGHELTYIDYVSYSSDKTESGYVVERVSVNKSSYEDIIAEILKKEI